MNFDYVEKSDLSLAGGLPLQLNRAQGAGLHW